MTESRSIFTNEYLDDLRRHYEGRRSYEQPLTYGVAVGEDWRDTRAELESWIRMIPDEQRPQVIGNLRNSQTFFEAYHELAVGALLRSLGFQPQYEETFENLTPDWFVDTTNPLLLIEVVTVNEPDTLRRAYSATVELYSRIVGIPFAGTVKWDFASPDHSLQMKQVAQIARGVRRWLIQEDPNAGAKRRVDKLVFEVVKRDDSQHLRCRPPFRYGYANRKRLEEAIKEKVKRYEGIALEKRAALVIAVTATGLSGLSLDSLLDVLLGSEAVKVSCKEPTEESAELSTIRVPDGLFESWRKTLSAVLWVEGSAGQWRMEAFLNPYARNPVPDGIFGPLVEWPNQMVEGLCR